VSEAGYDLTKFKVFICYHEKSSSNTKGYAKIISDILGVLGVTSFVAHLERNNYSERFDEVRKEILTRFCKYFIFINTHGSLDREQIIKEFNMAYPDGLSPNPKFIVFRHNSAEVNSTKFENETRIKLDYNQPTFTIEEELVQLVTNMIHTYKIGKVPSTEELLKKVKLRNNLLHCASLIQKRNNLDKKILGELYVQNETVLVKPETWNTRDNDLLDFTEWKLNDFLQSNQRLIFVSASYGMGKTSWSYHVASQLAKKNLDQMYSDYIPIHIPLRHGFTRVNDDGDSLDTILSTLGSATKILFIFDALDEFEENNVFNIKDRIATYQGEYINSKAIITTRPNYDFQRLVEPDKYVRLRPFTAAQVNEFYKKYGIDLNYDSSISSGLDSDEITKPLFCWMISLAYVKNKTLTISNEATLNRVWLFFTIIHDIVLGKHVSESGSGYTKHALDEKLALRKIAELKHIYRDDLSKKTVSNLLQNFGAGNGFNDEILKVFDKLISTYFYTIGYEEHIDFIHRSFEEYLLAEFYINCILKSETIRINMKLPTEVTFQFFDGLLYLLKTKDKKLCEYADRLAKTYADVDARSLGNKLVVVSRSYFEDEQVYLNNKNKIEYPNINEPYDNLTIHRWVSIAVLNRLENFYKLDTELFFKLLKSSHDSIPDYVIRIDNIDLTGHNFEGDTSNYNLTKSNLMKSVFHGTFYGTNFSGANLSGSQIKQGTNFHGCNFSGANLNGIENKSDSPYSPHFFKCNFSDSILVDAKLSDSRFGDCPFTNADLSGADMGNTIFSSADFGTVKCNESTTARNIELLGKDDGTGFNKEWDNLKTNKPLVNYMLSKIDTKLKDIILRDNPDLRPSN